jgi:exodeoxyribonuclease VII small subunit
MSAKKISSGGKNAPDPSTMKYAEAMGELEQILEELEGDEIDVDELSQSVSRASELIRLCRQRLLHSKTEIEEVVADLEALDASNQEGDLARDADEDTSS